MEMRGGDIRSRAMRPTQTAFMLRKPQRLTGVKGVLGHEQNLGEEPSHFAMFIPIC